MSILNSILKVFLGDKSGKDLRKVTPLVDKINDYLQSQGKRKIQLSTELTTQLDKICMPFIGADGFIKFALGENVKQSNWQSFNRFPQTRMGVEQLYVNYFNRAKS